MWARIAAMPPKQGAPRRAPESAAPTEPDPVTPRLGASESACMVGNLDLADEVAGWPKHGSPSSCPGSSPSSCAGSSCSPSASSTAANNAITTRIPVTPVKLKRKSFVAPKTAPLHRTSRNALSNLSGNAKNLERARSDRHGTSQLADIVGHAGTDVPKNRDRASDGSTAASAKNSALMSIKKRIEASGKKCASVQKHPRKSPTFSIFEGDSTGVTTRTPDRFALTELGLGSIARSGSGGQPPVTSSGLYTSSANLNTEPKPHSATSLSSVPENDYTYFGSSIPVHASTPSKQVTLLKRINLIKKRYPVASPTMQRLRGKVLSPGTKSREQVQSVLAMFERRIALQDRAAAVLSLLTQAEREHVIGHEDALRLKDKVNGTVAWIDAPSHEWWLEQTSVSSSGVKRGGDSDSETNSFKTQEVAAQEDTLGALVEIESEVRQLRRIVLTGGGVNQAKVLGREAHPVPAPLPSASQPQNNFEARYDTPSHSAATVSPATGICPAPAHLDGALERVAQEKLGSCIDKAMSIRCEVVSRIRVLVERYFVPVYGKARGPKPVLKPSGSFALGICDQSSDVDLVCVFPKSARWNTFPNLARYLTSIQKDPIYMDGIGAPYFEIRHVTHIEQAAVPLISFDFILHKLDHDNEAVVKVDLLFVRLPIPAPLPAAHLLPLDDDAVLLGMDSASVKGLNGVRSAAMILSMVDSASPGNSAAVSQPGSLVKAQCSTRSVFLDALRIVRSWAKARYLYGFKYGFLGGISWAIMLGHVYSQMLLEAEEKQLHFKAQLQRQQQLSSDADHSEIDSTNAMARDHNGVRESCTIDSNASDQKHRVEEDVTVAGISVKRRVEKENVSSFSAAVRASLEGATPRRGGPVHVVQAKELHSLEAKNMPHSSEKGSMAADKKAQIVSQTDNSEPSDSSSLSPPCGVTAGAVVRAFFARMSTWEWPAPVQLCQYHNDDSSSYAVRPWNPSVSRADRAHVMPVLTPVRPVQNTSTSVTHSTREVLRQEFWLAHCHLSRSTNVANSIAATAAKMIKLDPQQASEHEYHAEEGTTRLASDLLNNLLGDAPFFAAHNMFIQITLDTRPCLNAESPLETTAHTRDATEVSSSQEEAKIQNNLYDFITGSAKRKHAPRMKPLMENTKEYEERLQLGEDGKMHSLAETEENLHSFVTFVESRIRDLVCHLEQCPVDKEFTMQHPQQQPFIVHPFTRPFYELDRKATSAESFSSPAHVSDLHMPRESEFVSRAYFFLALKGMVMPTHEAVASHVSNWIEVVRSEYQFSSIAASERGSSSEEEDASTSPPPAPHVDICLVPWNSLPDIVFNSNNGGGQMLSREHAAHFREAQRMHMHMHMHQMQMQMQMQTQQMHMQHNFMLAQHKQQHMHQKWRNNKKVRAHRRRNSGQESTQNNSKQESRVNPGNSKSNRKQHNFSNKKMLASGKSKNRSKPSGVQDRHRPIHPSVHHHHKSKGTGHRRHKKSAGKINSAGRKEKEAGMATQPQQQLKKRRRKKKKKIMNGIEWPELV